MKTNKLDEMKARHAKEVQEMERCEAIRALLPEILHGSRIMVFSNRVHVSADAESLSEALEMLRACDAVPFLQLRAGFLHHEPRDWIKPRDLENATDETECFPAMLTIDGSADRFGACAKFRQFCKLSTGEVIQLTVQIGSYPYKGLPDAWRVRSDVKRNRAGDVTEARHSIPNICGDTRPITWSNSHARETYSFSWVWCERGTFDNEMERYLPREASAETETN